MCRFGLIDARGKLRIFKLRHYPTIPFEATLEVRDCCLCLHVQRAARTLARRFDDVLRPAGLTNQQFSLLMSLNRPEPPTMAPVAHLLGMDRTTLTAALKPLEQRGLLVVEADPTDRRSRRLRLTKAGHALLLDALPIWKQAHLAIEAELPEIDVRELITSLRALG